MLNRKRTIGIGVVIVVIAFLIFASVSMLSVHSDVGEPVALYGLNGTGNMDANAIAQPEMSKSTILGGLGSFGSFGDDTAVDMDIAFDGSMTANPPASAGESQIELPQQPLIIRTGNLDILVEDTEGTMAEIDNYVQSIDGWVVSTELSQYRQAKRGSMMVRVPVAQFKEANTHIKELAIEVQSESSSGQDVSEEFVDVTARLANLEATADRVRAFLNETQTVEEALEVNRELSRLEAEIESLTGRRQYLSQSAAFSTIYISLTPDSASQPIEVIGWRPQGVAKEAIEDLVGALQGLANIGIRFVLFLLPLLLIVGVPLYLVVRLVWRKIRSTALPSTPSNS